MDTIEQENRIITGKICPYCSKKTQLIKTDNVFNKNVYGWKYICQPCEAYVFCHSNTHNAIGRLGNVKLHALKVELRYYIDTLLNAGIFLSFVDVNRYIRKTIHKTINYCHVENLDEVECEEVIYQMKCELYINKIVYADYNSKQLYCDKLQPKNVKT